MSFEFDDFMDAESQHPITLNSDDSFDEGPVNLSERRTISEKYESLKEESKKIDEMAIEVRSLLMICKQMEECYSRRINRNEMVASLAEIRYLHDGTCLAIITIHNVTNQPMADWTLSIHPSPVVLNDSIFRPTSSCQTVPLGTIASGAQKSFECHVAPCEPPVLLELSLVREFRLEEVRKVFRVELDPICVSLWSGTKVVADGKQWDASFTSSIRIPNNLIDLLSGCPDSIVTASNVLKAILKIDTVDSDAEDLTVVVASGIRVKVSVKKDGNSHHILTIGTDTSRSHTTLAEQLRVELMGEMSKLKSKPPTKGVSILVDFRSDKSLEDIFQSMLAAFC